jgi:hypothetical protein
MLKAVKKLSIIITIRRRKNTATSGYTSFRGVCVYACILCTDVGDLLGCNFLCYG